MKKKQKNYLKIIIWIFIILYLVFGTDFISETKKDLKSALGNVNSINKEQNAKNVNVDDNNNLVVTFIDVGQADCTLIKYNNKYMLIDAGNEEDGNKLVTYFKDLGINEFNYVVATHPHEDHIGGMDDIINNFKIDNFYMPDTLTTTKTFENMLDSLENNNLLYDAPKEDYEFNMDDINFKVLHVGGNYEDLNDVSIVLKLTYGNISFMFNGDATSNVEKDILDKNIKATVLKVPHHGSSYSSSNDFINKVNPKYAVISVGLNNSYNHPSSSVIKRLNKKGTEVYRTDKDGTIIFTCDKENINITTTKTDTNG